MIYKIKLFLLGRKNAYLLWEKYPFMDIRKLYDVDKMFIDCIKNCDIVLTENQEKIIKNELNDIVNYQVNLTLMHKKEFFIKRCVRFVSILICKKAIFLYE